MIPKVGCVIYEKPESRILKNRFLRDFIRPDYEGYCLSNIMPTVAQSLGSGYVHAGLPGDIRSRSGIGEDVDTVLFFLVDGFGYKSWTDAHREPFVDAVNRNGFVCPLTSVFPSTTAAALTTVSTGLLPSEHLLAEWNIYMEKVDSIIETLPFRKLGAEQPDALAGEISGSRLFMGKPFSKLFAEEGIESYALLKSAVCKSVYSKRLFEGANIMPHSSLGEMLANIEEGMRKARGKSYFYIYWSGIDDAEHKYGPSSVQAKNEIALFSFAMRRLVERTDMRYARKTRIVITADHGQIDVDPSRVIYLNGKKKLESAFRLKKDGERLSPAGSPRDMFLYIKEDMKEGTIDNLRSELGKDAEFVDMDHAISEGLFGSKKPETEFRTRVGDVLALPRRNNMIWYMHKENGMRKVSFRGHHGGMSKEEMLIPLAVANMGDLKSG